MLKTLVTLVTLFFRKKVNELFKNVLEEVYGVQCFIRRYERQTLRGSVHLHACASIKGMPPNETFELAFSDLPKTIVSRTDRSRYDNVWAARKAVLAAVDNLLPGFSECHPSNDPSEWPPPEGSKTTKETHNALRMDFTDAAASNVTNDFFKNLDKDLSDLVNRLQLHNHTPKYCSRKRKRKSNGRRTDERECRFGYTKPPMGFEYVYSKDDDGNEYISDVIKDPDYEAEFQNNPKTQLLFPRNHGRVVGHLQPVLQAWRANVDFALCPSYSKLLSYILKYALKPELQTESLLQIMKAFAETTEPDRENVVKIFQRTLMRTIFRAQFSKQQAADILMGEKQVEMSHFFRTVNVNGSVPLTQGDEEYFTHSKRRRTRKFPNFFEAYQMRNSDPNFVLAVKQYESGLRQDEIHPNHVSLYEFVMSYEINWKKIDLSKKKHYVPHFLPVFNYIPKKHHTRYNAWCEHMLTIFKPGKVENILQNETGQNFELHSDALSNFVHTDLCPRYLKQEFAKAQIYDHTDGDDDDDIDELFDVPDEIDHDATDELVLFEPLGQPQMNEIESLFELATDWEDCRTIFSEAQLQDMEDWISKVKATEPPAPEIEYLNPNQLSKDQFRVFALCIDNVLEYLDCRRRNSTIFPSGRLIHVCGQAGSGKTRTIKTILSHVHQDIVRHNMELDARNVIKLIAPTGTAAFIISGQTVHSLFQIYPKAPFLPLSGPALLKLQDEFRDTSLVIIDEKSMLGKVMLGKIDNRLRQAKSMFADCPFGNLSVLLVGDFGQLPPVMAAPLYGNGGTCGLACEGERLYKQFSYTVNFEINFRVNKEESGYQQYLQRHRNGRVTESDYTMLEERQWHNISLEEQRSFKNALRIFAYRKPMQEYNYRQIIELGKPIAKLTSKSHGSRDASTVGPDEACGLERVLYIAEGAKVMLTTNLWTEAGLTNGVIGTVEKLIYLENQLPDLPDYMLVRFNDYVGPSLDNIPGLVCLSKTKKDWVQKSVQCSREQFPVTLAFAITIHKAQGKTVNQAVVDIGSFESSPGLSYVGCSRTRSIKGLLLDPLYNFAPRYSGIGKQPLFQKRLQEDRRLEVLAIKTACAPAVKAIVNRTRLAINSPTQLPAV